MDRYSRRRKKRQDSPFKTIILLIAAAAVVVCAVLVISTVVGMISSDYGKMEKNTWKEATETETSESQTQKADGWIETEDGFRYAKTDGTFLSETWEEIDGFLYYFDENGIMASGEWKMDGQIFICSDKGYLKDIQWDSSYVPDHKGESVDSLVKAGIYWYYLGEASGAFKPILYRKAAEDEVMTLGASTTQYSMRVYGDYLYFLPKVKNTSGLTEEEKELCGQLFCLIPGSKRIETVAENVDGYLVIDNEIYYSQNGSIQKTEVESLHLEADESYHVEVKGDGCYLLDGQGQAAGSGTIVIEDRAYQIGPEGEILSVSHASETEEGISFEISNEKLVRTESGERSTIAEEPYGIQSYCVVGQSIYYCAYVKKDGTQGWSSQIYRISQTGENKQPTGEPFYGTMENLYYFENMGGIYGEYYPNIWESSCGEIAAVGMDGIVYEIQNPDQGIDNSGIQLAAVQDDEIICLLTFENSTKAAVLERGNRVRTETVKEQEETEAETQPVKESVEETTKEVIIRPIETKPTADPNADKPTSSGNNSGKVETIAPSSEIQKQEETEEEVRIIPLG